MGTEIECPVCKTPKINSQLNRDQTLRFFECPVCGRYELSEKSYELTMNKNHLASYLFYHSYSCLNATEYRYNTILDKEECDRFKKVFQEGHNISGLPVHMDSDMIEAWYPHTFSEKIDNILLYLNSHMAHVGQQIRLSLQELISLLFVDRFDIDPIKNSGRHDYANWRGLKQDCIAEVNYMLQCLDDSGYISWQIVGDSADLRLTPNGYKRVDELQKNTSNGRNVLVAMQFGDDTKKLREAIRKGIEDAGYIAIFIDEVQHNDFITPELLKYIRDSKFVVVDLTHRNNGAYFEEGYAMGLGKTAIQLCKHGEKLHFDVAQKNTIKWENEEDISERLCNRIRATID